MRQTLFGLLILPLGLLAGCAFGPTYAYTPASGSASSSKTGATSGSGGLLGLGSSATGTASGTGAPLGISVLGTDLSTPGDNSDVTLSVLSTTQASTAPVQANVLANGAALGVAVSATGAGGSVLSPLVSGTKSLVTALLPGTTAGTLDAGTAPLGSLLNLNLGGNQIIGTAGQEAPVTLGIATGDTLLNIVVGPLAGTATPASSSGAGGSSPLSSLTGVLSKL